MAKHALLSPSGAHRWLVCSPSAVLESKLPDRGSFYADEGSLCHSLGELLIRDKLGWLRTPDELDIFLAQAEEHSEYYSTEMYNYADDYACYVMERFNEARRRDKNAQLFLEQRLDLTAYVPDGFGTTDCLIVFDGWLEKIDLKYGQGVAVSAEWNEQLMTYALGAYEALSPLFEIDIARLTIYQPRINNTNSWECTTELLINWGNDVLKPGAAKAFKGEGEYVPGEHCKFCRAKPTCAALKDYVMDSFKPKQIPGLITAEEISEVLTVAPLIKDWLSTLEEYALKEAVEKGINWPGFKLVEGRSNRVITDPETAKTKLLNLEYTEDDILNIKLKGITDLTKLLGKKKFDELLTPLIIKPPGKPTLVPVSDQRPEWNSVQEAFKNVQFPEENPDPLS